MELSCTVCTLVDIDCDPFTGDLENIRTTARCEICGADLEAVVKLADVLLGTAKKEWTKVAVNN